MIAIKKKVIFGITSLGLGGAERVLTDIVNRLAEFYDITIFSIYDGGELKKELNEKTTFKSLYKCEYEKLGKLSKVWSPIRILLFGKSIYKKYIKSDYDVEVAFLEGPITRLFSKKNPDAKKIAWIHNDIQRVFGLGMKALLKKNIDKKIYMKYNSLVFVSKDNMASFKNVYSNIDSKKMRVIYNYIDAESIQKKAGKSEEFLEFKKNNLPIFVTVCRLVKQKGLDRYVRIHSMLIKNGYMHKVYVIGDGPEKTSLMNLIKKENVENTFCMLGKKENPYPYINNADYFCLLSYFEGYGMVLEEAKILNKNIIITDTAAREAINGYTNSIIVRNDEDSIYECMKSIIEGKSKFKEDMSVGYSNEKNLKDIIELIKEQN